MQDWMEQGLCREVGGDLWYAQEGEGATWMTNRAVQICRSCPVQIDCLRYALEHNETHGVWGGTTQSERRKLLRLRRESA